MEVICSFSTSLTTALFLLSTPSIAKAPADEKTSIREIESCSMRHGQHFEEQDGKKQGFLGCTSMNKALELKDVLYVPTFGQMHNKTQLLGGKIPEETADILVPVLPAQLEYGIHRLSQERDRLLPIP